MEREIPFRGPNVWHQPKTFIGFSVVVSASFFVWGVLLALGFGTEFWEVAVFLCVPWFPAVWVFIVRPRLVLHADEVVVVGVLRTQCYPLRDIVRASVDGFGGDFELADGRSFTASTLAKPNFKAWVGVPSRGDKVATKILCMAADLRGEPHPEPLGHTRSMGNTSIPFFSD